MKKLFSLQIDVSKRALKTELEEIENKSLNASNDVPTADIQNQISMLEGRINSTNDYVDIQSDNINEIKVRHLLFSVRYFISNLKEEFVCYNKTSLEDKETKKLTK